MHVNHPCPAYLSDKNKTESGYFCSSCSKCVIDFRGKSVEEIRAVATADTCGIFNEDQLSTRPVMRLSRRALFFVLGAISFLGFSVKPLHAQQEPNPNFKAPASNKVQVDPNGERKVGVDTCSRPETVEATSDLTTKPRRKYRRRRRKNENWTRTIGCPSF